MDQIFRFFTQPTQEVTYFCSGPELDYFGAPVHHVRWQEGESWGSQTFPHFTMLRVLQELGQERRMSEARGSEWVLSFQSQHPPQQAFLQLVYDIDQKEEERRERADTAALAVAAIALLAFIGAGYNCSDHK